MKRNVILSALVTIRYPAKKNLTQKEIQDLAPI